MTEEILEQEQPEQPEQEQPEVDPNLMAQARLFGYREDYDGKNKLSPQDFVDRARKRLDIAQGTIKTIERTNAELMAQNEQLSGKLDSITGSFKQFVEMSRKSEERAYERAKKELEAKMEQAVEDSDTAAYKKTKAQLDDLEAQIKEHPALTGKEPEEVKTLPTSQEMDWYRADPAAYQRTQEEWIEANPWFETEMDMALYADGIDKILSKSKAGRQHKTQQERLEAITNAVKKKFPEYFGEKPTASASGGDNNRRRVGAVEGGGAEGPPTVSGKKTYADLPKEAKLVCDQLVSEGILTKDDYVKTFQWD